MLPMEPMVKTKKTVTYLPLHEAASRLDISNEAAMALIGSGVLKAVGGGGKRRVTLRSVQVLEDKRCS